MDARVAPAIRGTYFQPRFGAGAPTMPCNHIMLDLETLSTRKDAAIIQIAALAFDPETGELGKSFNAYVNNSTGHVSVPTVGWWLQQLHAPKIGAEVAGAEAVSENDACRAFREWMLAHTDVCPDLPNGGAEYAIWSHGATFDIVVLENACARIGISKPWSYRVERDTRTLYALAPGGMPAVQTDPARVHDARYDCEVQVQQVVGALRALREQAAWKEQFRLTEEARASWERAFYDERRKEIRAVPAFSRAEAAVEALANPATSDELL